MKALVLSVLGPMLFFAVKAFAYKDFMAFCCRILGDTYMYKLGIG